MRILLDTNVLVAALLTKGTPPDSLYQAWRTGVSGDKSGMLALGTAEGIPIVSVRAVWERLRPNE